jgi:HIRAN domain
MDAMTLHAGGTVSVVGDSYRQGTLERLSRSATGPEPYLEELKGRACSYSHKPDRLWFRAALMREPTNEHDPNAVAVHATGIGLVGYLDRQSALDYAPVFEALARHGVSAGACPAMLTGGERGMSWGLILCLSSPEAVVGDLRASESANG